MEKLRSSPKTTGELILGTFSRRSTTAGVSVAEMNMTVRGTIAKDASGHLVLDVGPNRSFEMASNELSKELEQLADPANPVTVRGRLYKKPEGKKKPKLDTSVPLKLLVLEIQKKD